MGKYTHLKTFKKTKARAQHNCYGCGKNILKDEIYYREIIEDRFLHNINSKKYCISCYENYK
ncbi:MAG: hypothetical protein AAB257_01085 [Nitrospinota bacterium]